MIRYLIGALALTNLAAFLMMGLDKRKAMLGRRRIPEKTLLAVCSLFAAAGGLIGMRVFHHKTRKPKFSLGVPLMLTAQLAITAALVYFAR